MVNTHVKGSKWRRDIEVWLQGWGWSTRFRSIGEAGDDITAELPLHRSSLPEVVKFSIEAKNHKTITLAAFVDQCVENAGPGQIPVCIIKRRGKAKVEDGYAVMPCWALEALVERLL